MRKHPSQCYRMEKQRKCSISFPETARSRSHHAFYEPQPPRTLTGNELVLDGGREAADVGGIDAERSVHNREGGIRGRGVWTNDAGALPFFLLWAVSQT